MRQQDLRFRTRIAAAEPRAGGGQQLMDPAQDCACAAGASAATSITSLRRRRQQPSRIHAAKRSRNRPTGALA
jgi:hypothetical protein